MHMCINLLKFNYNLVTVWFLQHVTEMNSTKEVIAKNRAGARALYSYLLGSGVGTRLPGLSHSQLMTGSMNEITKIKEQVKHSSYFHYAPTLILYP